jgi:hypothetical protein
MPVTVGEQVSAETARYCASVATGIFHANLFAEEIDLENITYITAVRQVGGVFFWEGMLNRLCKPKNSPNSGCRFRYSRLNSSVALRSCADCF